MNSKKDRIVFKIILLLLFNALIVYPQHQGWKNYTSKLLLCAVDDGDFIWAGGSGLVKINKATGSIQFFNKANSGLPNNYVKAVAKDNNSIWVGTHNGVANYSTLSREWIVFDTSNSLLPSNTVSDVCVTSHGVWIATAAGLVHKKDNQWVVYNSSSGFPFNYATAVAGDSLSVWVGSAYGAIAEIKVNATDGRWFLHYGENKESSAISSISVNQDEVWVAKSFDGFLKYDGQKWREFTTNNSGLPSNSVNTIFIDKKNIAWISTYGSGIVRFDEELNEWRIYDNKNIKSYVTAIAEDTNQTIWFATIGNGLVSLDIDSKWHTISTSNSELPFDTHGLRIDNDNIIVLAGWGNAFQKKPDRRLFESMPEIPLHIKSAKAHNASWLLGEELYRYEDSESTVFNKNLNIYLMELEINDITATSNTVWLGTDSGIVKVTKEDIERFHSGNSNISFDNLTNILAVNDTIWFSSPTKVGYYDGKTFSEIVLPPLTGTIIDILIDPTGQWHSWIITTNGLLVSAPNSQWNWRYFETADVPLNKITSGAIDTRYGTSWFGSSEGLIKYDALKDLWKVYNSSNSGLPEDCVFSVAISSDGTVFMETYTGIGSFNERLIER